MTTRRRIGGGAGLGRRWCRCWRGGRGWLWIQRAGGRGGRGWIGAGNRLGQGLRFGFGLRFGLWLGHRLGLHHRLWRGQGHGLRHDDGFRLGRNKGGDHLRRNNHWGRRGTREALQSPKCERMHGQDHGRNGHFGACRVSGRRFERTHEERVASGWGSAEEVAGYSMGAGVSMALCKAATGAWERHCATRSRAVLSQQPHWVATPSSNWISSKLIPAWA